MDERVGCCLAFVEELAIQQHLVEHPSQLERFVSSHAVSHDLLLIYRSETAPKFGQIVMFLALSTVLQAIDILPPL